MTWLQIERSDSPLILTFPHGGTDIPAELVGDFHSRWLAVRDTDWHIRALYEGLADATRIWTEMSRSVIDCNRDPSGASLYPGMTTTDLCPTETFDGEPLYRSGAVPDVEERRRSWFTPYHEALEAEIARLRGLHGCVIVYDCHSIRSRIPRMFDGELPELNFGTNNGASCDPALTLAVAAYCGNRSHVINGRFRGGWTTRHHGRPSDGVHAIQMEISMRAYVREPAEELDEDNWPPTYDPDFASPLRGDLARILAAALDFAKGPA
jgi:formiminoglutamase